MMQAVDFILQEEDLEALKQFVLKKRPHVIVVATGSRDSQSVLEDIKLSMRELEQENQVAPINVELVDHEVAEIFEKSSRAEVHIEIINNTRGGIVIFFTENKRERVFGGQIHVPDAGPGAYWLS